MTIRLFFLCRLCGVLGIIALANAASVALAEKPVLRIYTYDSFASEWGPGPVIAKTFEQTCACTVEYVATDDAVAMLSRLLLEGENTRADLLIGLDNLTAGRAAASGMFAPHRLKSPVQELPFDWQNDLFVPYDWGVMAFIYNRETMPEPPRSFAELQALPDEVKIVLQDPRTSSPGHALLVWLETLYGAQSATVWRNLRPKILTFTKGWWEAYSMYLEGEADLVLSYSTSPAYHQIVEQTDKHRAAAFSDGHLVQIELAGIVRTSDRQDLARRFLRHLQSPEAQAAIPTTNWMFPIRQDIPLPEAFGRLIAPEKLWTPDPATIEAKRRERIARWRQAVQ